ncbi:MauE/DoxX family redox-associated membrane protein [Flavobacterium sp. J27]|uniref:MauE/DoxX family redox-associated membrane protein n=1 Tax=Flavobacterium sp. J27 TaxID=2060419 RepID=UPI0035157D48
MQLYKKTIQIVYYFLILFISYTTMNKFLSIESFQTNLLKTGFFEDSTTIYLSYLIILTEFVAVLILIFYKKLGALLMASMLSVFTIYILILRFYGRYEVCGCGGVLNGLQFKYHLMINVVLVFSSFLIYNAFKNKNLYEN